MQVDKMFHHILLFANTFRSLLVRLLGLLRKNKIFFNARRWRIFYVTVSWLMVYRGLTMRRPWPTVRWPWPDRDLIEVTVTCPSADSVWTKLESPVSRTKESVREKKWLRSRNVFTHTDCDSHWFIPRYTAHKMWNNGSRAAGWQPEQREPCSDIRKQQQRAHSRCQLSRRSYCG